MKKFIFLLTALILSTQQPFAQTGPAGVGNSNGDNNQPENVMWFNANSLGLSNGSQVETWTDISGNDNHASQPEADSRPTYTTGEINGLPAVVFDGSNDYLPFDGNLIANSDYTVIIIGKRRTSNTFKAFLGGTTSASNRNLHLYWYNSTQFRAHQYGNDLQTNMVNTSESYSEGTSTNEYGAFATLLASAESTNQRRNYQNNHYLGSRSNAAQLTDYTGSAFGRYTNGYHDVNASEVIFYSNALNDAQLQIVYQYLNVKYNVNIDNDLFEPTASHKYDVIGVGSSDGTQKHTQSAGSGGGLYLAELNSSFDEANEFVFASHNNAAAAEVSTDLPTIPNGTLEGRSARQWYVAKTSSTTDISIGFQLDETGLAAGTDNQLYNLLYKANTSDAYSTVTGGQAIISNGKVWFNIENANFSSGYYTIARSDQSAYTWYSYNSGDWNNWQSWSLEAGGTDIVNPDNYTPSTSPTASVDKVVILHPYEITVSTNGKENAILEVRDGTINFGSTLEHSFASITGQGTIKLSADNFPTGNATVFTQSGGGTVEYIGTGHNLSTPLTLNNLSINLTNSLDQVTLLTDYSLNGNFTIKNGVFQINDNTQQTPITLNIAKNVDIEANGSLTIGQGNTADGYAIGGTMPALGMYHAIFHQVKIGGNFTNAGIAKFTNLSAPNYSEFATDGAATVTFYGTQDNTAYLSNNAVFYNLIIDKGVDQTHILELYSENDDYFGLYGPNNVGRRTGGIYTGANPEVRKALWIKNGTLKLDGYSSIPSLSEGATSGGNGDYPIPGNGCLWIAGNDVENVKVYSTARTASAEVLPGTTGISDGGSNQALSVYGKFKITNGYFNTRNSAGFIFWPDENAVIEITGGLCDVAQFRSADGGTVGKTSFIMSGGELMVRGNEQFTYNLEAGSNYSVNPDGGGEITGSYPAFGIIDEDGVFQMSGGKMYIADRSGNNEYESNALCIDAKTVNHSATEGEVIFLMKNNEDYDIKTNGELYSLSLINRTGTDNVRLHMGENLTLKGDLNIGNYAQLIARKEHGDFNGKTKNLKVGRSFNIATNGDYRPRANTTTLLVTYTNSATFNNSNQDFFNLIVKNNPDITSTSRQIRGNSNTVTVHNNLTVESGATLQFRQGNKTLLVKGNISNSGTINNSGDNGKVLLSNSGIVSDITVNFASSYTGLPTITIAAPAAGGTQATAVPVFNGIPASGNALPLAGIEITNSGSGYETAPTITLSGGALFGINATASATLNSVHEIAGDGNGSFHNVEIDEPHPDETAGKETVTHLAANTKVTGTLSLTDGILDLETHGLDLEGSLSSENEGDFSETQLIRMEGNHGDVGMTRYIDTDGDYLFPIGTYNEDDNANRYAWAKPTISSFNDDGKVQINAVPNKLPTLGESSPDRYLKYYWRMRHAGFSILPQVENHFNSYVDDYSWDGTDSEYIIGKIIDNNRYGDDNPDDLGTLEAASGGTRLLNYLIAQDIEDGTFTAAFAPHFNGAITVYYSYFPTWYGWTSSNNDWKRPQNWSKTPHGEPNRSATSNNGYPQVGDVAVLGRGDHSTYPVGGTGYHSINIRNAANIECAEIRFEGARLTIEIGTSLNAGIITGNSGTFMPQIASTSAPTINADFSEFNQGNGNFNYWLQTNNALHVIQGYTNEYPNLRIEGGANRRATIAEDFTVNGQFIVDGNTEYVTYTGAEGDILVKGELRIGGYLGGTFSFNTSGQERRVEVGAIRFNGTRSPDINHLRSLRITNSTPNNLRHHLLVNGNIFNDLGNNINFNLFTNNTTGNNVILEFSGENDQEFQDLNVASIPSLYKIVINKGANQTPTVTLSNNFTLNGSTDGDFDEKSIDLQAGTLKLNHPDIDITLTSGGDDFIINSKSKLWVNQGTARVTNPGSGGIFLDGTLSVEGEGTERGEVILNGGAGSDNYIEYSSSGNASLDIKGGYLYVGSQIRSSTQNNLGVLRYRQLSKSGAQSSQVYVGMQSAPEGTRGVFEIFNPGSQFQMYSGDIYIARAHDVPATATRAALYLDPASTGLNEWSNIQIGLPATTPANSTIKINATPDLCHLTIDADITAQLDINPLSLVGQLDIISGSTFDGNGLNLNLYDDIDNAGTANLNVDTLLFVGNEQEITGDVSIKNMDVNSTTSVTAQSGANITITNDLILNNGALNDNGETIVVQGNLTNNSTHSSLGTGRIKLEGTALQNIYGEGSYANIELNNSFGARLNNSTTINGDLYLTDGIFDIQAHGLTLSVNSEIQGSDFGNSKMIASNGSYADLGLTKKIPTGAQLLTLPIGIISGVDSKYTPVTFDIINSSTEGAIRLYGVNQAHMTAIGADVLQYFWTIESTGLSNFNAEMTLNYLESDVIGTETDYISAHLYNDSWAKFGTNTVDEATNQIVYNFPGVSTISGDFTAGIDIHIPANIPIYENTGNGSWSDISIWTNADGIEVPAGGPNGHIVRIIDGTTVNMNRFRIQAYRTELNGRLEVGSEVGHNLGKVSGGGTLAMTSQKWPVGDFTQFMAAGTGSTIEYGGGTYNIPGVNGNEYNNLVITGAGTKTFPRELVYIYDDLSILEDATLETQDDLYVYSDFTLGVDATYSPGEYTIFIGNNEQHVYGDFTGRNSLKDFYLKKSSNTVNAAGNIAIRSLCYLRGGVFKIEEGYNLTLNNGIYSGSESYINNGETWVEGELAIYLDNGTTSNGVINLFPIGKNGKKRFVRLNNVNNGGVSKKVWSTNYYDESAVENGIDIEAMEASLNTVSAAEHWMVGGPSNGQAKVSVEWGTESDVDPAYLNELLLAEWNGSQWISKNGDATGDANNGIVNNTTLSSFTSKAVSKYFTLASSSDNQPLPISLISFTADLNSDLTVKINWSTANEKENDHFIIEKSHDGVVFTQVQIINGAGYSNEVLNYQIMDREPYEGLSYYRLKQIDFDGAQEIFPMVAIRIERNHLTIPQLNIYPNPYREGNLVAVIDGINEEYEAFVTITDIGGNILIQEKVFPTQENLSKLIGNKIQNVNPGFYIIMIQNQETKLSTRIIKK